MSGYVYCACRDCMEIVVGEPGDFCCECIEAGCPDYQGVEGMSQECQKEPDCSECCWNAPSCADCKMEDSNA